MHEKDPFVDFNKKKCTGIVTLQNVKQLSSLPNKWCNGKCAYLEYRRSLVRVQMGSNIFITITIHISCVSPKHTTLRRKRKDWLARNQDDVSDWCDMFIHRLLFQLASTMKIQLSLLV